MTKISATPEMIHERLYHVAKAVISILEAHDMPYSIAYGTLLGAVRHQGFIPWDDDFDLWLFDDTYDEAIEYLRNELPDDMFLEDAKSEPLYFHAWAHVKDLNSITTHARYPQDDEYQHKGLHVDLYRCRRMKEAGWWEFVDEENRKYIERRRSKGLISDEEYNIRMEKLRVDIEAHKTFKGDPDKDIIAFMSERKYIEDEGLFPLVKYKFEDSEFYGFKGADKVLTEFYGDYMTPPPVDNREPIHSEVIFI